MNKDSRDHKHFSWVVNVNHEHTKSRFKTKLRD